ncbi:hypothetical protein [Streptomyces sp. KLOTTS4A1]|uniref:hypothetical protein n=1 Tax=Streptomyces sp. KLOTTS4A1 TaxID=3390996 RepID=UPI0039F51C5D
MEAGPRDTAHDEQGQGRGQMSPGAQERPDSETHPEGAEALSVQGRDGLHESEDTTGDTVVPDGPDPEEEAAALAASEVEVELRPQRKLRIWQIAPIVVLATLGSLMFAFPLAFAFDDGGAVVAMLGLLISCCAAGWGVMAARRVGHTWPGLPARGSGNRPDWRVVLTYTTVVGVLAVLAVWRVARLR